MKLRIKVAGMKKIDAHALKTFPYECVGLLIGTSGKEGFEVKKIVKAKNTLGSPVAFEADPQFVYKVYKDAEKRGTQLVGIYHSHPDMHAFVSSRDAEFMKYWGNLAWLILGLSRDEVLERKAFTMKNKKIEEIEVVLS
ncbi:MAG: M67 family metallopeptidase [Methanobacteriota archaeon]